MIYLSEFYFPKDLKEELFINGIMQTYSTSFYPFGIMPQKGLRVMEFAPITILYGGNGSGKTTALNVIAEKLQLQRDTLYNRTEFFDDYTKLCAYENIHSFPEESRIITSDDVFDFMLNLRSLNAGIDKKREELFAEYTDPKFAKFQMKSIDDYEKLKKVNQARRFTFSNYVRSNVMGTVREHSNGESAFIYFVDKIKDTGLYLLDEPENSLSPAKQQELMQFIEDGVRFYDCQFIIATHSPFLLSMRGAKVYDLDETPVEVKRWTELASVQEYYKFFKKHEEEFEE